ncbi:MAG: GTPase HflX [Candidatus Hydrogenedentes bacterium]|nr:GTPase HflX [Candidatus Hydrogenedentota bacterium]
MHTIRVEGNTQGLSALPLRRLDRLATRKTPASGIISPEFARALTETSLEIKRQVAVLIDRRGQTREVIVGDARSVLLPDLREYRRGRDRLSGLRLIHTHLNGEPLTDDDLTDLAVLRLDLIAAIEVLEDGLPGRVFTAHLLPNNEAGRAWELETHRSVHELPEDFPPMIEALEAEFARVRQARTVGDNRDRAILVHVSQQRLTDAEDSMQELKDLSRAAGIDCVHAIVQRRPVDPRFVMGRGKLQDAVIKAMQLGAEAIVFDQNLTPAQVNALSEFTDLKVLDRTQVILDIFAQRAQTREGKIQVELAQLRYLLPRLGSKQTALAFSRLTGGIGGRGPGETKLEIDRRRAQERAAMLEREVKKLGERRKLRRSVRSKKQIPTVSIVGYTNAGKSTLLNHLTRSTVVAEDILFATLNPVSRRLRFPQDREIIITDTVGFIRNLPKELMAAFRTTLEELGEADLLLHVIDACSEGFGERKNAVEQVIQELGLGETPVLLVLNKADRCDPVELEGLARQTGGIPVSALDTKTFGPLMVRIQRALWDGIINEQAPASS